MDELTAELELPDEVSPLDKISSDTISSDTITMRRRLGEVVLLVLLFFVYAGDLPPMVNECTI